MILRARSLLPPLAVVLLATTTACGLTVGSLGASEQAKRDLAPPEDPGVYNGPPIEDQTVTTSTSTTTTTEQVVVYPGLTGPETTTPGGAPTTTAPAPTPTIDLQLAGFCADSAKFFVLEIPRVTLLVDAGADDDEVERGTDAFLSKWQTLLGTAPPAFLPALAQADDTIKSIAEVTKGRASAPELTAIEQVSALRGRLTASLEPAIRNGCGPLFAVRPATVPS